jgi:hypothetical protein
MATGSSQVSIQRKQVTYPERLKDPRWQKLRLMILQSANWRCEDCGCGDKELQVHHCAYMTGKEPWDYPADLLMCVCPACHQWRQQREDALRVSIGKITRFLGRDQLEAEAWRMVGEMAGRETDRMAEAFA